MRRHARTLLIEPRPFAGDAGLLCLRLGFGLGMAVFHGWSKLPVSADFIGVIDDIGIPAPTVLAWTAVLVEFVGGILICVGLLTRPAALGVLGTMLVAFFVRYAGLPIDERELSMLYAIVCLALLCTGPGRYSLDHLIAGRAPASVPADGHTVQSDSARGATEGGWRKPPQPRELVGTSQETDGA